MSTRTQRDEFLVFGSPLIGDEEIDEVVATLKSGWIGTGPRVAQFERDFAAYKSAPHALALNSCTAALHIAVLSCGIEPGDEVITSPLTFAATANAIVHAGAKPVFADCDPVTMNLDPDAVRAAITPRTKAILPIHFAGRPCEMDELMAIAAEHDLRVVEDCAHAIESTYRGRPVGTIGDFGCFSFYVTKNLVTGEGGMLLTRSEDLADQAKVLSLHGMSRDAWKRFSDEGYRHYQVIEAGFKYNMMDLQAALGLHQLARIEATHARREAIWQRYDEALADLPCRLPAPPAADSVHGRHLYTLVLDTAAVGRSRDDVLDALAARKIGVGVHYVALHTHPYYRELLGHEPGDFPNAHHIGEHTISIPLSAKLTDDDVDDVIAAVRSVLLPT